ncbi:FLYWCH-type zinc finger-containing protein 1-like [Cydia pomonella]|uniref:FLYWCH-type zinc finger-containing protein 1-like n=1 Tax=Cydia pomonella TaxID=82600 RepID=UPI002ADD8B22|nr:FLYWCH-type zinc finger-containing protein 1-like [Cydia pomonella]
MIATFQRTKRGNVMLIHTGYKYHKERTRGIKVRWQCAARKRKGCPATATTLEAPIFLPSKKGGRVLCFDGYKYHRERQRGMKTRWHCGTHARFGCAGSVITVDDMVVRTNLYYGTSQLGSRVLYHRGYKYHRKQEKNGLFFGTSHFGNKVVFYRGYKHHKKRETGNKTAWHCGTHRKLGCRGMVTTIDNTVVKFTCHYHHPVL